MRNRLDNKSISSYLDAFLSGQVVCKLSTDLFQVDCESLLSTGLLQVVSTSCNKSANDKLQKTGNIDLLQQVYGLFGVCRFCVVLYVKVTFLVAYLSSPAVVGYESLATEGEDANILGAAAGRPCIVDEDVERPRGAVGL